MQPGRVSLRQDLPARMSNAGKRPATWLGAMLGKFGIGGPHMLGARRLQRACFVFRKREDRAA